MITWRLEKSPDQCFNARIAFGEHPITLPDFIGIGGQKCGTTWLHVNLKAHPGAFLPEPKELHFFDRDWDRGIESYQAKFAAGAGKIKGEITPAYGVLPPARIAEVHQLIPAARLIVMLRDPVRRAWSQATMNLVTQKNRRFEDVPDREFFEHFQGEHSLSRGDYATILANWIGAFGREPIWIGMYDDLETRPRELLAEVFAHVGLSTVIEWSTIPFTRKVFEGAGVAMPDRFAEFLRALYRPRVARLGERFGIDVSRWKL
jgi:hypothetical protein